MDFLLENTLSIETFIKIGVAALLSLIIGIERELKKKPVGLKTSLVIATFSCLLTVISIDMIDMYHRTDIQKGVTVTMDPLRLAAQIVSGVGFLGAGVILRKGNDSISGLTTAAMIWGASGIGIAVGAGFYIQAIATVIIVMFGIEVIAPFLMKIGPRRLRMKEVVLKVRIGHHQHIQDILDYLHENEMEIEHIRIKDIPLAEHGVKHELDLRFSSLPKKDTISLYNSVRTLPYIERIEIEILS